MQPVQLGTKGFGGIKMLLGVTTLWIIVLLVNYPILSFDMMYYEQPIIYLANHQITSFADLWHVYWHPRVLEAVNIPFFRPSGHFLVYQLLTQFMSWHNTRGFLAVNFFFLALSCYWIIKIYTLLLPRYRTGAYIACGVYLMHPALMLSRLTPMHFEFASVAFALLGLYIFMVFSQRVAARQAAPDYLVLIALFFYFVSITFKEVGLMLGPVMALYLCIATYQRQSVATYVASFWCEPELRTVLALLVVMTCTFAVYLSMMWGASLPQQLQVSSILGHAPVAWLKCMKMLFGLVSYTQDSVSMPGEILVWEIMIYPLAVRVLLWLLTGVTIWSAWRLFTRPQRARDDEHLADKKAFLFLLLAAIAFLLLPVLWGRARPWHLALSLVFVSQLFGFGVAYGCRLLSMTARRQRLIGLSVAVLAALLTLQVVTQNVRFVDQGENGFALRLNRNAVLFPPKLKQPLTADTVLVVEDSLLHNDYLLGDSVYPDRLYGGRFAIQYWMPFKGFYQFPTSYGGTLFRWAYLFPTLKEEVYPFQIDHLQTVSTVTLSHWLQHFDHLVCLGYDSQAAWHDRTIAFKKQLLQEKARRHLRVSLSDTIRP